MTTSELASSAAEGGLPASAKVVVIGGGVVGASVAYHLAEAGWRDVVVLEQGRLAGGTTWHAAGLVGRLRTSSSTTRINQHSVDLYSRLEEETGVPTGWTQCGSLVVARTEERMTQLRRTIALGGLFGVEAHTVDRAEITRLWPGMRTDDLVGGVSLPGDGKVRPDRVALAMAKGARDREVRIFEECRVENVESRAGKVHSVTTNHGTIRCEHAVICCGMWSRELGLRAGVTIPLYPVEHHYMITDAIDGVHHDLPVVRDPDAQIYFRADDDRILLGAFQRYTKPWDVPRIPDDFSYELLEADWPKFADPLAAAHHRVPAIEKTRKPKFVNGPECFTPDNHFILGETPELRGCWVAAGFNSAGIACAGGAGRALADWMVHGDPGMDLWSVDVRRFAPFHNHRAFLRERATEVLGLHYRMAWPNREMETGRGIRHSPIHERLKSCGAAFGSKMGWERPNWFAPGESEPKTEYSFGRQNWFEHSAAEHRAARETAALFDQTSFSKLLVTGRDALKTLQPLAGANLDVPCHDLVYTGLFNERGTFESDLTIVRLAEDEFLVITATSQTRRDADWIARNTPDGAHVSVHDVTTQYGVIGLMGPNAPAILASVTDADLSNHAFPFGSMREIEIGPAIVRALRITYVGERGWELHVRSEQMRAVYDAIVAAGGAHDLRHAGNYAINSLRLEKAYRAWGHDISPDDTPLEAGLSFAIDWDKPGGFLGRDALLAQREVGVKKRLVCFVLDDPAPILWGSEPILRDGKTVGYTTSAGYAHTLGGAIGLGYVRGDGEVVTGKWVRAGKYEIEIAGERFAATPHLRSPYDPKRERIL